MNVKNKIGIFDSGVGGLTVAKAIYDLCPNENLLYIGDTAHMPWGDKSKQRILLYATKIAKFLIDNGCNIIVVACSTASANVLTELTQQFSQIKLFNVIDPIILFLQQIKPTNVGIIGTKQTINSNTYQRKIASFGIQVKALATPILAPLIEEGLMDNKATDLILEQYLTKLDLQDQSMLILGCTHYRLIKKNIENYYIKTNRQVKVIDGAGLVANELKDFLFKTSKINKNYTAKHNFYITDDSEFFLKIAQQFFANISLDFLPLWDNKD